MKRKTWIKIKRGLLEKKHIDAMGPRLWLYLYMLDQTDWGTGEVQTWRDSIAGQDLGQPERTIREQRIRLAEAGYIECVQKQRCLLIRILNWTNPREYSGHIYNPSTEIQGGKKLSPLGGKKLSPSDGPGWQDSDIQGGKILTPLPSIPHKRLTEEISHSDPDAKREQEESAKEEELMQFFSEKTGIPVPFAWSAGTSLKREDKWGIPCRTLLQAREWDIDAAKQLMTKAIEGARARRLLIGSPNSVLSSAMELVNAPAPAEPVIGKFADDPA